MDEKPDEPAEKLDPPVQSFIIPRTAFDSVDELARDFAGFLGSAEEVGMVRDEKGGINISLGSQENRYRVGHYLTDSKAEDDFNYEIAHTSGTKDFVLGEYKVKLEERLS